MTTDPATGHDGRRASRDRACADGGAASASSPTQPDPAAHRRGHRGRHRGPIFVPPFPMGQPGEPISGIGDLIKANLEFPAPARRLELDRSATTRVHHALPMISTDQHPQHDPSRCGSSMALLLVVFIIAGTHDQGGPGRLQNASSSSGRASRTGPSRSAGRTRAATSRCSPPSSCSSCSRTGAASCRSSAEIEALRAPDERRQRHDRARAGRLLLLPLPGLPAPRRARLPRQVLRLHRVQAGHRERASSTCSSA